VFIRRSAAVAVVLALLPAAPALASRGEGPKLHCSGDPAAVQRLDVTIAGTSTWGLYALPSGRPKGLVAFDHGYGHTPESWRKHLTDVARRDGVIAFAMDYRGSIDGPEVRGWQVAEGAEDTIAVARMFDAACRVPTIVAYGVSMGGNTSGLALAARATRVHGERPLFDWWVDVEGAANVTETYAEARSLAASGNTFAVHAQQDIEREMGGAIEQQPDAYRARTVVARVDDIAASGLGGVVIVHGVGDGLVPYDQSRELASALRARGVPVQFFTVGTKPDGTESGTTLDGYAPVDHDSPFAGHASEASDDHVVGNLGFARLDALFRGDPPATDRDSTVDGKTGTSAST
jgi:acetyl esterase/lipase